MPPKRLRHLLAFLLALLLPAVLFAADSDKIGFFEMQFDKLGQTFFPRLLIDLVSVVLLIGFLYFPTYRKKDFFFTFIMFNVTIFFITYILNKVDFTMGAAFGLFAVFSLLRYRTEDISAKDMTYLFVVIALGLVSAANKGTLIEVLIINGLIIATAFVLEGNMLLRAEETKNIQYDDIEKIHPSRHAELMEDLRRRTGLDIHKFSIGRIDYLRDTANIKIYYYDRQPKR